MTTNRVPTPNWAAYHADVMISFIEKRTCPHCGDSLHKRVCDNRSGVCGQDWNDIYVLAKKDRNLANKYFAARAESEIAQQRQSEAHAHAESLGG